MKRYIVTLTAEERQGLHGLIAAGKEPDTPVACVRWGTVPEQRTITGTLEDIADRVAEAGLKPPAIIVVGLVVAVAHPERYGAWPS